VAALKRHGQLTKGEEEQANTYLSLQERPWPHATIIQPGATLYLDGLAVHYLQHLKLLGKLRSAGFTAVIATSEIEQNDALVRHQAFAERATEIIEEIRAILSTSLASGRVRLGHLNPAGDVTLLNHPAASFFKLASSVDALIADDRFLNRHLNIKIDGDALRPIYSSFDLLNQMHSVGKLSTDQLDEAVTKLRRGGFVLIPVSQEEFRRRVASVEVIDGRLVENAELRAIRESFERLRMTDILQLPLEAVWLDGAHLALVGAIRAEWMENANLELTKARCDWLLALFDIRGWAHRTRPEAGEAAVRYRSQILLFANGINFSDEVRPHYWQWLEEKLLSYYRGENPEDYAALLPMLLDFMERTARDVEERLDD
jgi:hypothetical protein